MVVVLKWLNDWVHARQRMRCRGFKCDRITQTTDRNAAEIKKIVMMVGSGFTLEAWRAWFGRRKAAACSQNQGKVKAVISIWFFINFGDCLVRKRQLFMKRLS